MIYLRHLNNAIQRRTQTMHRQRQAAAVLVHKLKHNTQNALDTRPVLLAMGLALGVGFVAQRLHTSHSARRYAQQVVHLWSLSLALPKQWTHALQRWLLQT